jgi:hypothetical protein
VGVLTVWIYLARIQNLIRIVILMSVGQFFVARAEQRPLKGRMRPKEIAWFYQGGGKNRPLGVRRVKGG